MDRPGRALSCLTVALALAGCAHIHRYTGPGRDASLEYRQALLQRHAVRVDDNGQAEAQDHDLWSVPSYVAWDAPQLLTATAWAGTGMGWRDLAWIASVAGALQAADGQNGRVFSGVYVPALALAVFWESDLMTRMTTARESDALAFDRALARDLDLDGDWAGQFDELPERFPDETSPGGRLGVSVDTVRISGLDEQAYFAPAKGPPPARIQDEWAQGMSVWWAWCFRDGWTPGVEAGLLTRQDVTEDWKDPQGGPGSRQLQLGSGHAGFIFSRAFLLGCLGRQAFTFAPQLSLDWAWLAGTDQFMDPQGTQVGSYNFTAWAPEAELSLRLAAGATKHGSAYLELGWQQCSFSGPQAGDAGGGQQGLAGTDVNGQGRRAAWNFSGPVVKAGLMFY